MNMTFGRITRSISSRGKRHALSHQSFARPAADRGARLRAGYSAGRTGRRPDRAARNDRGAIVAGTHRHRGARSEEHTSELQSLMRISYAVFCLKKKNNTTHEPHKHNVEQTQETTIQHHTKYNDNNTRTT